MEYSQSSLFRVVKPAESKSDLQQSNVSSLAELAQPAGQKGKRVPVSAFQSPLFPSKLKQMEQSNQPEPLQSLTINTRDSILKTYRHEKPLPQLPDSPSHERFEQQQGNGAENAGGFVELDFTQQNPMINDYDDLYQNFRLAVMQLLQDEINYPLHLNPEIGHLQGDC